jgi:hypothetical protein
LLDWIMHGGSNNYQVVVFCGPHHKTTANTHRYVMIATMTSPAVCVAQDLLQPSVMITFSKPPNNTCNAFLRSQKSEVRHRDAHRATPEEMNP